MLESLQILTTLMLGLFSGSLLTEGVILVPYWRRMQPEDFFRLHGTMGPVLFRYFAPLTTISVVLTVVSGVILGGWNIPAACLCLGALAIFFLYFKKANDSFANHSLANEKLAGELKKWQLWHWLRTLMIIVAFLLTILA